MEATTVETIRTDLGPCSNCGRSEVVWLSGPSEPYGGGYWCDPCLTAYYFGQGTQTDWLCHVCPELSDALAHYPDGEMGAATNDPYAFKYRITLNAYQISNLRAAIQAAGYGIAGGSWHSSPLSVLINGDWIGELYQMLPDVAIPPNAAPAELVKRALNWVSPRDQSASQERPC